MTQIKFGTDGWRAIIGAEYTTDNVARVSDATANWLKKRPIGGVPPIGLGNMVYQKHQHHYAQKLEYGLLQDLVVML